jgi:hypothetical protein
MFHTAFVGTLLRCGKSDMDWAFANKQCVRPDCGPDTDSDTRAA